MVALVATAMVCSACDAFYPASMATKDSDGTMVILPLYCTTSERIFGVSVVDTQSEELDSESRTPIVLWSATAIDPNGARPTRIRVGDAGPEFHETSPLLANPAALPGARWLEVHLRQSIGGDTLDLSQWVSVGSLQAGRTSAGGWPDQSEADFPDFQRKMYTDLHGGSFDVRKLLIAGAVLVLIVAVLASLDERDRRRRRRASASTGAS